MVTWIQYTRCTSVSTFDRNVSVFFCIINWNVFWKQTRCEYEIKNYGHCTFLARLYDYEIFTAVKGISTKMFVSEIIILKLFLYFMEYKDVVTVLNINILTKVLDNMKRFFFVCHFTCSKTIRKGVWWNLKVVTSSSWKRCFFFTWNSHVYGIFSVIYKRFRKFDKLVTSKISVQP